MKNNEAIIKANRKDRVGFMMAGTALSSMVDGVYRDAGVEYFTRLDRVEYITRAFEVEMKYIIKGTTIRSLCKTIREIIDRIEEAEPDPVIVYCLKNAIKRDKEWRERIKTFVPDWFYSLMFSILDRRLSTT